MKRKLAVGVLSAVLLVGGATAAFADTNSSKLDEIKSLTQQVLGLNKQIADKEVEAGLITQPQADAMKSSMDLNQKNRDQALDNGQVFGPGMGGRHGGAMVNNGEPMTDDQIKDWDTTMQVRLKVQEETMKANGSTAEQIKAWSDAMQAQLKVQEEALKKGTSVNGGMGMGKGGGGMGMHGGNMGATVAPTATAPSTAIN